MTSKHNVVRRRVLFFFVCILVLFAAAFRCFANADPRDVAAGVSIYEHGYCDQPYVVVAGDGTWVCVFTTSAEKEGAASQYIVCTRSTDRGKTWSAPVPIETPDGPEASWAMPLLTRFGRIYVFYVYNGDDIRTLPDGKPMRADTHGWYCYRFSDDNGLSWSDRQRLPMRVTACDRENPWGGAVQMFWGIGKPVTLGDTAWFGFTKLARYFVEGGEGWFYRSDNVLTEADVTRVAWDLLPDGDYGLRRPDFGSVQEEHNLVPLSNGDLYCVYRTTLGYGAASYSRDGGHSWSVPEYMQYADGHPVKNPRACPRLWRCANGHYLFWFHNHSGKNFDGRNPGWLSGGVERDGRILWSEPEIVLYSNDPPGKDVRYSYPDLIESEGRYWITTTQKTRATVHEVDAALLEGLWSQLLPDAFPLSLPQPSAAYEAAARDGADADSLTLPALPSLGDGGFSLELVVDGFPKDPGIMLLDGRMENGQGMALSGAGTLLLNDGVNTLEAPVAGMPAADAAPTHLVITLDGAPHIVTFIVNGRLCDGGEAEQYGWRRFSPAFGAVPGALVLRVDPSVKFLRFYDGALTTSQAVRLHRNWQRAEETSGTASVGEHLLEDGALKVSWNDSGAVTAFLDKKSGHALSMPGSPTAQAFSLLVKTGDTVLEIRASEQKPPRVTAKEGERRFTWEGPLAVGAGASFDITAVVNYALADGALTVGMELENRSEATVIEVRYPQVTGLAGFRGEGGTAARLEPIPGAPVLQVPFNNVHVNYPGGLNMGFVTAVNDTPGV